jgi:DNA-3-methyladenine glycosylase
MALPPLASNARNRLKRATSRAGPEPTSFSGVRPRPEPAALGRRLERDDLPHETTALARALIGKLLVRVYRGVTLAGRIVETEAYFPADPASHAFRGVTRRNRVMFGPPLHAYVYFIYGANWCLNVTAEGEGIGAAALVRACEPLLGLDRMRKLRGRDGLRDRDLARGPGNLCRAFGIGPKLDGEDLARSSALWLADDGGVAEIGVSARIGVSKAADAPLRFYARGNLSVSGPRALSP